MHCLFVVFALLALGHAQKTVDAPQPALIEVPSLQTVIPGPLEAVLAGTVLSMAPVPPPTIPVPHHNEIIDVPHTPIQIPSGGVQESTAEYDIPQPIVSVPGPVIQEKPVVFNVPQDIIQVPRPVIRHRPILYKVPHILRLQRPVIRHNQVLYDVARAHVSKSGYVQPAVVAQPVDVVLPTTTGKSIH